MSPIIGSITSKSMATLLVIHTVVIEVTSPPWLLVTMVTMRLLVLLPFPMERFGESSSHYNYCLMNHHLYPSYIYIYTYVYIYINKKHGISIGGSPIYSYHLIPTPQMAPRPSAPWCWRAATAVCTCWAPTSCWSWAGAATNHGTEPTWAYIVIYGD